jgi:Domain of unknown function (DUF5615)
MRGFEASPIIHMGLSGTADHNLRAIIAAGDFTFVTNNARDFVKLYRLLDIHAGLIIILPNVRKSEQRRLFGLAIDAVGIAGSDPVNQLVEIDADGRVTFRQWPDPSTNI